MALARFRLLLEAASDADDEERGEGEGRGVEHVGRTRPRPGDEHPAEERADGERHVLAHLEQAVRPGELRVAVDETRQARIQGRPEEARGCACDQSKKDYLQRTVSKRKNSKNTNSYNVCRNKDTPSGQAVEQGRREKADDDQRHELGDEERAHPRRAAGAVVHVDDQCDERKPRTDRRAERGEEEEPEIAARSKQRRHGEARHRGA